MITWTVARSVPVPVERLFDTIVAEDVLPKILRRWGPVPAVTATRDLSGPWDTPGSTRTVVLGDGSTAREEVLDWFRPDRFRYRVDTFTSPLGRLVGHAIGEFWFEPGARFTWTYAFAPRRGAQPAVRAFVRVAWSRYMEQCADECVLLAQAA